MLLTSAREWPDGGEWVLEPKWDGYRFVAEIRDGRARCWTRHGTDVTARVGEVARELVELLPDQSVVDGELVALAPDLHGRPGQDFNRLWDTVFGRGDDRLSLVIFDAPRLGGEELGQRPWHERRSALQAGVPAPGAAVSVIDAFDADPVVHERLLALGFEGSSAAMGAICPGGGHAAGANTKRVPAARPSWRSRLPTGSAGSSSVSAVAPHMTPTG
jgi:bifunctional non-homologous end joining protein LigD